MACVYSFLVEFWWNFLCWCKTVNILQLKYFSANIIQKFVTFLKKRDGVEYQTWNFAWRQYGWPRKKPLKIVLYNICRKIFSCKIFTVLHQHKKFQQNSNKNEWTQANLKKKNFFYLLILLTYSALTGNTNDNNNNNKNNNYHVNSGPLLILMYGFMGLWTIGGE